MKEFPAGHAELLRLQHIVNVPQVTSLAIPSRYHKGASILSTLDSDQLESVQSLIRHSPYPYNSLQDLDIPGLSADELAEILEFISSLFYLLADENYEGPSSIVKGIEQYLAGNHEQLGIEPGSIHSLCDFLATTLEMSSPVKTHAKAIVIRNSYANVYLKSRILTDLRPIIEDLGSHPAKVAITHNLKITYYQSGDYTEFFVALDDSDLGKLSESLLRAKEKSNLLRSWAMASNIDVI